MNSSMAAKGTCHGKKTVCTHIAAAMFYLEAATSARVKMGKIHKATKFNDDSS